jgi:Zn-dependent protease/CBS domain-containing protein
VFSNRVTLFRLLGFEVKLDASWLLLALLIAWSTAKGWFGPRHPELSAGVHFALGLGAAVGLLVSIVFHELSHSIVARTRGIRIQGITLFLFGGVAEMQDEPEDPRSELYMAIVGPIASFVLAGLSFGGLVLWRRVGLWEPIASLLTWMALINLVLGVFNLVPAFPLDGGRVLRAILWELQGDVRSATRIAAAMGSGFGLVLILWGVLRVIGGDWLGVWSILIGLFLRTAAKMPYRQLVARQALAGEKVRRFMVASPITVPRSISVQEMVEGHVLRHQRKSFPVVEGDRVFGLVTLDDVKAVPREDWPRRTVGEIARAAEPDLVIGPDAEAVDALARMSRLGVSRLLVTEGGRLLGILSLRDLLDFLALKLELEER